MQNSSTWLTKLKAVELHRLAVLIGSPCSGTKAVQIQGIQNALSSVSSLTRSTNNEEQHVLGNVSLVSIDMGIRNLAYAHWTTSSTTSSSSSSSGGYLQYDRPTLQTWRKIDVSSHKLYQETPGPPPASSLESVSARTIEFAVGAKESFEPVDYAGHAYHLVKNLLDRHDPTTILIERQRFRSGGNAAVQEWTIRVGVFEGMLYAVLKSLAATQYCATPFSVQPILPSRLNRYWLQNGHLPQTPPIGMVAKLTGRDVKKAKIELAKALLNDARNKSEDRLFNIGEETEMMVQAFLTEATGTVGSRKKTSPSAGTNRSAASPDISKLDDLADSLLQGLGWMHWQNNRLKLSALKQDAFDLTE